MNCPRCKKSNRFKLNYKNEIVACECGWNGISETFKRKRSKIGRNDMCPCASGKKYKKCCLRSNS